jgi:hypothetical protein
MRSITGTGVNTFLFPALLDNAVSGGCVAAAGPSARATMPFTMPGRRHGHSGGSMRYTPRGRGQTASVTPGWSGRAALPKAPAEYPIAVLDDQSPLVLHINREALQHGAEIACCPTSTPSANRARAGPPAIGRQHYFSPCQQRPCCTGVPPGRPMLHELDQQPARASAS